MNIEPKEVVSETSSSAIGSYSRFASPCHRQALLQETAIHTFATVHPSHYYNPAYHKRTLYNRHLAKVSTIYFSVSYFKSKA